MIDYPTILTIEGDAAYALPLIRVDYDDTSVTTTDPAGAEVVYPCVSVSFDRGTGRLYFVSEGTKYRVRDIVEDDGQWLSKYHTLLPIAAIEQIISGGKVSATDLSGPDETIDAYALDDSAFVLGLLYTNDSGRWSRVGGDWVLLDPNDETFDDMDSVFTIDPDRTDEFLELYDNNFVSVDDAEAYEAPEVEEPEESEEVEPETVQEPVAE